ncbi:MAG: hypothetical protein H6773_01145 [Pseudomonadales bacterium]|nr:hypothetical protein [Candidatus Woesebacteria bacterium]MCB9800761.1 hypothetical protein [Pseudomonadales bacterium]
MKKNLSLLVLVLIAFAVASYATRVSTIVCIVGERECTESERNQFVPLVGKSLFFTRFDNEIPALLTDQTLIFTSLKKQLPGSIFIILQKEKPVYLLQDEESTVWTVYENGMIVAASAMEQGDTTETLLITTQLPIASVTENSTMLPKYHSELTQFSFSLYKSSLELQNRRWIDANTLELTTKEDINVFMPLENTAQHVRELEAVLNSNEAQTLPKPLREIDLRYKYPVLRTDE